MRQLMGCCKVPHKKSFTDKGHFCTTPPFIMTEEEEDKKADEEFKKNRSSFLINYLFQLENENKESCKN